MNSSSIIESVELQRDTNSGKVYGLEFSDIFFFSLHCSLAALKHSLEKKEPLEQKTEHNIIEKELDIDGATLAGNDGMNLNYFGKRYFDPDVIRWISVDPVSQYWDMYSFCDNNPINKIDPDGNFANFVAGGVINVLLGVAIAKATGSGYTITDASVDFILGGTGAAIVSKVATLGNVTKAGVKAINAAQKAAKLGSKTADKASKSAAQEAKEILSQHLTVKIGTSIVAQGTKQIAKPLLNEALPDQNKIVPPTTDNNSNTTTTNTTTTTGNKNPPAEGDKTKVEVQNPDKQK